MSQISYTTKKETHHRINGKQDVMLMCLYYNQHVLCYANTSCQPRHNKNSITVSHTTNTLLPLHIDSGRGHIDSGCGHIDSGCVIYNTPTMYHY